MANELFLPNYDDARKAFREASQLAGGRLEDLPLSAAGPSGESLFIDAARFGAKQPRQALIHFSGVHGLEGFVGSAVQRNILLRQPPAPDADQAVIFVHAVNPYGMTWRRRTNERNVDLNRNCLPEGEAYAGEPDLYPELDPILNPPSPPTWLDPFWIQAGFAMLRHGAGEVTKGVAEGQYERPKGLFYGGTELEEGPRRLFAWLANILSNCEQLLLIDIHTGLGEYGEDMLLTSDPEDSPSVNRLTQFLGERVTPYREGSGAYRARGELLGAVRRLTPAAARSDAVTQEFGTYRSLFTLAALRDENRWHHWGEDPADMDHPVKQRALATFMPDDEDWRKQILARGQDVYERGMILLFSS